MKNIYEILEFNKILTLLSNRADSEDGKKLCENLKVINSENELETAINETDGAVSYLKSGVPPVFRGIASVDEALLRLSKDASL